MLTTNYKPLTYPKAALPVLEARITTNYLLIRSTKSVSLYSNSTLKLIASLEEAAEAIAVDTTRELYFLTVQKRQVRRWQLGPAMKLEDQVELPKGKI